MRSGLVRLRRWFIEPMRNIASMVRSMLRRPKRRGTALALLVVLLGAGLMGGLVQVRVDAGVESFLPTSDPTLAAVERKARDFGGDPVIVLLRYPAPRQFLTDHDQLLGLLKVEGQLAKLPDVATVYGPATVLNQLAGAAQNFLAQIAGRRDGLRWDAERAATQAGARPAAVTAAGDAAVAQLDLRYAPLVVKGLPVGLPTLSNPRFGAAVMFGPDGQAKPEWRFIVPAPDTVAVLVRPRQHLDETGTQRMVAAIRATVSGAGLTATSVTISGVPAVTAELTAEVTRETPLIGALVVSVVLLRFLLVPGPVVGTGTGWGSWRLWLMLRLRPLLASLLGSAATVALLGWLGHPLSLAVVLLLPLLLGVGSSFPLYLATVPNRRRVLVMSIGSSAAFLALALSPLQFVRDLGFTLAAGILLTVGAALLLGAQRGPAEREARPTGIAEPAASRAPTRAVQGAALSAALAVGLLGWVVLPRLSVQANPVELASGLPALADAAVVESVLGASGEIGIEITGPDVVGPQALAWAHAAQRGLDARQGDQLRPVMSPAGLLAFLGPSPTPEQVSAAFALLPSYLSSSVVRPDHHVAMLLYGVRLQDLGAQERMLAEVRATLPPPPAGYRVDLVGLPVAAASGYRLLMDDRYLANVAGIGVAGLALLLGLRRRGDAVRAVVAAALATGWGLAALWLLGVQLSPLTVALGSLITVTGCEFVVLLSEADRWAQPWLRRSVIYACLTSVVGYLVLTASRLWMVREFGLVLGAAVMLSYLAARLVLWLRPPGTSTVAGAPDGKSSLTAVSVEVNA
jgi:predicted RND superfamily exporter protein